MTAIALSGLALGDVLASMLAAMAAIVAGIAIGATLLFEEAALMMIHSELMVEIADA